MLCNDQDLNWAIFFLLYTIAEDEASVCRITHDFDLYMHVDKKCVCDLISIWNTCEILVFVTDVFLNLN